MLLLVIAMEDSLVGVTWDMSLSKPYHMRGNTTGSATSPVKSGPETTHGTLVPPSPSPSGSGSSSTWAIGESAAHPEALCHAYYSTAEIGRLNDEGVACHRCVSEPMYGTATPFQPTHPQTHSSLPMDVAGGALTVCRSSSRAVPSSLSGTETDTEAEADNPLLSRRDRVARKRGSHETTASSKSYQHDTFHSGCSAAGNTRSDLDVKERSGAGQLDSDVDKPGLQSAAEADPTSEGMTGDSTEDGGATRRLDELSVLSFNAGLLEYKLCGLRVYQNPPFTQRRLHHIPAALLATEADIICLQEIYGEAHADFIIESTRHKLPFVGRRTSGGRFSLHNGLMVLSKFPIVHTHFHKFEDVTYIERCFASKGMLEVAIDVPSIGVIAVFNIHLASGAVDPESRYVEDVRAAEIRQLLKACDAAADRGLVPLVIGDLNAAPHLCASNYKCFVERGWRDCWLHVHGHQRHILQHHLLHQQQLLDEQQLDDQGIELHDRHIRRDLFVRIRRQRRMQMQNGVEQVMMQQLPQAPQHESGRPAERQYHHARSLQVPHSTGSTFSSDADSSDVEGEQKKQLLSHQQRLEMVASTGNSVSFDASTASGGGTQRRGSHHVLGPTSGQAGFATVSSSSGGNSNQDVAHWGSLELLTTDRSCTTAASRWPLRSRGRSNSASGGLGDEKKSSALPMTSFLGGYFGRAGGGMQLPFAFELPAAAAWAHREFFLTAKRRLIEQQQKWLGGGDKAPVLDVRLSLAGPHHHRQRGVDGTPLESDSSLASCSTGLTAAHSVAALTPAATWRLGGSTPVSTQNQWRDNGADGSVADWLLSDTDEETEASESRDVVIPCGRDADGQAVTACSRRDFTWDPENPLNSIGPHAGCHGLRCDYVFLPPHHFAGGLYPFLPVAADILMRDPRVLVDACCFGCFGEVMLVTLSDHYAVRITLRRSTDADIADFWGSCAAEATALRVPGAPSRAEPVATNAAGTMASK